MPLKTFHKIALALLSGVIFSFSWPPNGHPILLFIAFIPLLFIENNLNEKRPKLELLGYSYLAFVMWNWMNTFWLSYASGAGGYAAILANALLMSIPVQLFHITKKHYGERIGYISFLVYWLAFEYLHLNWDLSWAWLNIGNAFSIETDWIQWYEITGVLGGSFWVLLTNLFLYKIASSFIEKKSALLPIILSVLVFATPILVSYSWDVKAFKADKEVEVAIVQPNIDPYYDKFNGMDLRQQLAVLLRLSYQSITPETKFLLWPETALLAFNLNNPEKNQQMKGIRMLLDSFPQLNIISGASAHIIYDTIETATTRQNRAGTYYDEFNSSLHFAKDQEVGIYQKSKLVPLVENIPYPEFFNLLSQFTINLGGSVGSLGTQEEREVFFSKDSVGITPAVCYESVFGAYATDFTEKGGNIFAVLTNDAWWLYPENGTGPFIGSDKGYKQHFHYARLRAIENRRMIARSANTGISGIIDIDGTPLKQTKYWKEDSFNAKVKTYSDLTFYVQHGNYLGRTAVILSILILLLRFISIRTENFKYRRK